MIHLKQVSDLVSEVQLTILTILSPTGILSRNENSKERKEATDTEKTGGRDGSRSWQKGLTRCKA